MATQAFLIQNGSLGQAGRAGGRHAAAVVHCLQNGPKRGRRGSLPLAASHGRAAGRACRREGLWGTIRAREELSGMRAETEPALRGRIAQAMLALDPCVGYELTVAPHA